MESRSWGRKTETKEAGELVFAEVEEIRGRIMKGQRAKKRSSKRTI